MAGRLKMHSVKRPLQDPVGSARGLRFNAQTDLLLLGPFPPPPELNFGLLC